ncbi:hypothetical protein EDD85DRAFT_815899, partial [Armillaria nabsnona]
MPKMKHMYSCISMGLSRCDPSSSAKFFGSYLILSLSLCAAPLLSSISYESLSTLMILIFFAPLQSMFLIFSVSFNMRLYTNELRLNM